MSDRTLTLNRRRLNSPCDSLPPARCGFNMGMVWIDLTPEEMCNLMCGEPQEDEEEIDGIEPEENEAD